MGSGETEGGTSLIVERAPLAEATGGLRPRRTKLERARGELIAHDVYGAIRDLPALRIFMAHHAFAVWDFMALLKRLQTSLTCTRPAWHPVGSGSARRLVNEIVLGEESDQLGDDPPTSHLELYREAMRECGADTGALDAFLSALAAGTAVPRALAESGAPRGAIDFVTFTWDLVESGADHEVAAAFAFGREALIPDMFTRILNDLDTLDAVGISRLRQYLERHVDLDGSSHQHLTARLVAELCGDDATRWHEAESAALRSLRARAGLWDAVLACIRAPR